MKPSKNNKVAIVAILKNEERFLEEWLLYHLMIGVDHFFLYDDSSEIPVSEIGLRYSAQVTVITWDEYYESMPGRNRQIKAYLHSKDNFLEGFEWVAFIDCDEFIVISSGNKIQTFLSSFNSAGCITLNWHLFGHNGHYDFPDDLVLSSFTRRKFEASDRGKSICRSKAIQDIPSAHYCLIKEEWKRVDANNREYRERMYPEKTTRAHINHYQCRSFLAWRKRLERGDVAFNDFGQYPPEQAWRFDDLANLNQFVTTVATNNNEFIDEDMLPYAGRIRELIKNHPLAFQQK